MRMFDRFEEYPGGNLAEEFLPPGVFYEYVSGTFLNGLINYLHIENAYVLTRYQRMDEALENRSHKDLEGLTKEQAIELFNSSDHSTRLFVHSRISMFEDDVVMLCRTEAGRYWYVLWWDMDVSDCCIGRFLSSKWDEREVIDEFHNWVQGAVYANTHTYQPPEHRHAPIALNVKHFEGWLQF